MRRGVIPTTHFFCPVRNEPFTSRRILKSSICINKSDMETICVNQSKSLSTANASGDVFLNRKLSAGQTPKSEFQQWLETFQFGHFITVEPTPSCPMKDDDMTQRLREIDHKINKRFIGNRYTKFKNRMDRFWMVGFFEEGHVGRRMRHLHLLTHFPYNQINLNGSKKFKRDMVKNYVQHIWLNTPYFTYLNDVRPVCPMHIENIPTKEDSNAVSWYSTKELSKDMGNVNYFFFDNH